MEPNKFDEIIKRATESRLTRLDALRGLAAGAAAAVTGAAIASSDADAKNKKAKKAKKGKKAKGTKGGGSVPTTPTTQGPVTPTTAQCLPDGYHCDKDEKYLCCNGHWQDDKGKYWCGPRCIQDGDYPKNGETCCAGLCVDAKGKCKPCPTTPTTQGPVTPTTQGPVTPTTQGPVTPTTQGPIICTDADSPKGCPRPGNDPKYTCKRCSAATQGSLQVECSGTTPRCVCRSRRCTVNGRTYRRGANVTQICPPVTCSTVV